MLKIIVYSITFAAAFWGVKLFLRLNKKWNIVDIPNERSSHTSPTPRGGGLIIVLVSLSAYAIYTNFISGDFSWAYFIGALSIASISWLDDLYSVSTLWRFVVHSFSALLIVFWLGDFGHVEVPFWRAFETGLYGKILTFLWIVWLTNAYNFMDGIDGLAGTQAAVTGLGWLLVGNIVGLETQSFYAGVIAFSSIGFLIHNWHPAKIFMGDVGSAFLGYTFAVFPFLSSINSLKAESFLFWVTIFLVWLFVFDTVLTFIRRFFKREKVWRAHRSHIYQRLTKTGLSQKKVVGLYALISISIVIFILINLTTDKFQIASAALIMFESLGLFIYSRNRERNC